MRVNLKGALHALSDSTLSFLEPKRQNYESKLAHVHKQVEFGLTQLQRVKVTPNPNPNPSLVPLLPSPEPKDGTCGLTLKALCTP